MRRSALIAATAALALGLPGASVPQHRAPITLGDATFYSQGRYSAYASPWSTLFDSSLQHARDYRDTIAIEPRSFPADSRIRWSWPMRASTKSGVWGYMALAYGNYDGGIPQQPVTPRRVDGLRTLVQNFALEHSGIGSFNILNEFYLTRAPGKAADKAIEIGFFLHASSGAAAFMARGRAIGSYIDPQGREWSVAMQDRFCMFALRDGNDLLVGTLDVRDALAFLKRRKLITGREWFNGIAIGVEPIWGSGTMDVVRWQVRYA